MGLRSHSLSAGGASAGVVAAAREQPPNLPHKCQVARRYLPKRNLARLRMKGRDCGGRARSGVWERKGQTECTPKDSPVYRPMTSDLVLLERSPPLPIDPCGTAPAQPRVVREQFGPSQRGRRRHHHPRRLRALPPVALPHQLHSCVDPRHLSQRPPSYRPAASPSQPRVSSRHTAASPTRTARHVLPSTQLPRPPRQRVRSRWSPRCHRGHVTPGARGRRHV